MGLISTLILTRACHIYILLALSTALSACATRTEEIALLPDDDGTFSSSKMVRSTEHFVAGDRSSSAWISEKFEGEKIRQFRGGKLFFGVEQLAPEGGLDVGVSLAGEQAKPVSLAKSNLHFCSTYFTDLSGAGRWWAGPKVSVNWQGDESANQNGDDWYENYIVEAASSTPQDLDDIFTGDYFKAEELPRLTLAGSEYRNYKIRFHDWWQFWSVRQDYRASGTLPLEPIIDLWIDHGLPEIRLLDGVKANIETYGPIKGYGWMQMDQATSAFELNCDD